MIDIINQRGINDLFEIEDEIVTQSKYDSKKVLNYISESNGTPNDLMRLFLIYHITHNLSEVGLIHINWQKKEELSEFESILTERGADLSPLAYIKSKKKLDQSWETLSVAAEGGRLTSTFDRAKVYQLLNLISGIFFQNGW